MNKENRTQRAIEINKLADAAETDSERLETLRVALSSNIIRASITTPRDLVKFIAECWDQGVNPLPAFRKRLGRTWVVVAHCYATHGEVPDDYYEGTLFLEIPVNATGVQFRRV